MKLAPYPGWLFGWENPITQPESDPIYAVLTGFGHRKLSDSSDPGRVRTQSVLNVIGIGHRLTDEHLTQREISFIERETTALNTSCQEIQEPWLLAPSLGAPSCATAVRYLHHWQLPEECRAYSGMGSGYPGFVCSETGCMGNDQHRHWFLVTFLMLQKAAQRLLKLDLNWPQKLMKRDVKIKLIQKYASRFTSIHPLFHHSLSILKESPHDCQMNLNTHWKGGTEAIR